MKFDISTVDANFLQGSAIDPAAFSWRRITEAPFSIHGLAVAEGDMFARLPVDLAKRISDGVNWLNVHTAGGRVRFATNASRIAIRALTRYTGSMSHMPLSGSHGVDVYKNGKFITGIRPDNDDGGWFEGIAVLSADANKSYKEVEINLPLYNGICDMAVGVSAGADVREAAPYAIQKPIVYYGSSITQGGCASRPGNSYQSYHERVLNADYINLGFSGSARGEELMAQYVASFDMSALVLDYDHNAPSVEHLNATHERFFRIVRAAHPELPVIFVSKPDTGKAPRDEGLRRRVIYTTYKNALDAGDRHVYYVDGRRLFGSRDRDACTVDNCHPNDLGFYRMAYTILPVLKQALKEAGVIE